MDRKFLLATILLLQASTVLCCVKFHAQYHYGATLGDPEKLVMNLDDNAGNKCSYDGYPNDGGKYKMTCQKGTASLDPTANNKNGAVYYAPGWGPFNFNTDYTPTDDNGNQPGSYDAWVYGC